MTPSDNARSRALLIVSCGLALACGEPSAPCAAAPPCPPVKACPANTFDASTVTAPNARLALETLENLFAGRYEPVRALFTPELAAELSAEKLDTIVRGLVEAHGPPSQVVDAWPSEVREKEVRMPAAQVLLRMTNDTRLNLLLVFAPSGAVKGLWLRPI